MFASPSGIEPAEVPPATLMEAKWPSAFAIGLEKQGEWCLAADVLSAVAGSPSFLGFSR